MSFLNTTFNNQSFEALTTKLNERINSFYKDLKEDYSITGEGKARIETVNNTHTVIVDYTENGVSYTWEMQIWKEDNTAASYLFDVWTSESLQVI